MIYRSNPEVMSGGYHIIKIESDKTNLTFSQHNASDPLAEKIVAILNSNIPKGLRKLRLFNIPNK